MSAVSPEVEERLRKVQQQILAEPQLYNQYEVMTPVENVYEDYPSVGKCGTVCCVAGWLYLNSLGGESALQNPYPRVIPVAASLIDHPMDNLASEWPNLFEVPEDWPQDFADRYSDLEVDYDAGHFDRREFDIRKAQVAYDRIEHFIQTGE